MSVCVCSSYEYCHYAPMSKQSARIFVYTYAHTEKTERERGAMMFACAKGGKQHALKLTGIVPIFIHTDMRRFRYV